MFMTRGVGKNKFRGGVKNCEKKKRKSKAIGRRIFFTEFLLKNLLFWAFLFFKIKFRGRASVPSSPPANATVRNTFYRQILCPGQEHTRWIDQEHVAYSCVHFSRGISTKVDFPTATTLNRHTNVPKQFSRACDVRLNQTTERQVNCNVVTLFIFIG